MRITQYWNSGKRTFSHLYLQIRIAQIPIRTSHICSSKIEFRSYFDKRIAQLFNSRLETLQHYKQTRSFLLTGNQIEPN